MTLLISLYKPRNSCAIKYAWRKSIPNIKGPNMVVVGGGGGGGGVSFDPVMDCKIKELQTLVFIFNGQKLDKQVDLERVPY